MKESGKESSSGKETKKATLANFHKVTINTRMTVLFLKIHDLWRGLHRTKGRHTKSFW